MESKISEWRLKFQKHLKTERVIKDTTSSGPSYMEIISELDLRIKNKKQTLESYYSRIKENNSPRTSSTSKLGNSSLFQSPQRQTENHNNMNNNSTLTRLGNSKSNCQFYRPTTHRDRHEGSTINRAHFDSEEDEVPFHVLMMMTRKMTEQPSFEQRKIGTADPSSVRRETIHQAEIQTCFLKKKIDDLVYSIDKQATLNNALKESLKIFEQNQEECYRRERESKDELQNIKIRVAEEKKKLYSLRQDQIKKVNQLYARKSDQESEAYQWILKIEGLEQQRTELMRMAEQQKTRREQDKEREAECRIEVIQTEELRGLLKYLYRVCHYIENQGSFSKCDREFMEGSTMLGSLREQRCPQSVKQQTLRSKKGVDSTLQVLTGRSRRGLNTQESNRSVAALSESVEERQNSPAFEKLALISEFESKCRRALDANFYRNISQKYLQLRERVSKEQIRYSLAQQAIKEASDVLAELQKENLYQHQEKMAFQKYLKDSSLIVQLEKDIDSLEANINTYSEFMEVFCPRAIYLLKRVLSVSGAEQDDHFLEEDLDFYFANSTATTDSKKLNQQQRELKLKGFSDPLTKCLLNSCVVRNHVEISEIFEILGDLNPANWTSKTLELQKFANQKRKKCLEVVQKALKTVLKEVHLRQKARNKPTYFFIRYFVFIYIVNKWFKLGPDLYSKAYCIQTPIYYRVDNMKLLEKIQKMENKRKLMTFGGVRKNRNEGSSKDLNAQQQTQSLKNLNLKENASLARLSRALGEGRASARLRKSSVNFIDKTSFNIHMNNTKRGLRGNSSSGIYYFRKNSERQTVGGTMMNPDDPSRLLSTTTNNSLQTLSTLGSTFTTEVKNTLLSQRRRNNQLQNMKIRTLFRLIRKIGKEGPPGKSPTLQKIRPSN